MSKLILVDMDSILTDFLGAWLSAYNDLWQDTLTIEHLIEYDVKKFVKKECGGRVYKISQSPEFFDELKPLPGAVEGFKELKRRGHEVVVLSAPLNDHSCRAKMRWCQNYLKIRPTDVILASRKYLVRGDIFIDDSPKKLLDWKKANPNGVTVTIEYPYNRIYERDIDIYTRDYSNTEKAWSEILKRIG